MNTLNSIGNTPPKINTLSQPHCGIIQAAKNPPPAAPTVKPANTMVTIKALRRAGEYSLASVATIGMMPPMAKPAIKRLAIKCHTSLENATSKVNKPKTNTLTINTLRRPKRSPNGPAVSAPKVRPNKAALNTGAKSLLLRLQASFSAGPTKPMITTSKPSITTIRKQRKITSF